MTGVTRLRLRPLTVMCSVGLPRAAETWGLPLPVVASYVDRFGLRCNKVRVTSLVDGGNATWIGMTLDAGANLAAFGIPVDGRLAERVGELRALQAQTWTALEFGGTSAHPTVSAWCAVRTPERLRYAPVSGLVVHCGAQGPLLTALDPRSVLRLGLNPSPLPAGLLGQLRWPVESDHPAMI